MIQFKNVIKKYKQQTVIRDVSFSIADYECAVLIGPSGCGKTTILKMINRLLAPTSGSIYINGEDIKNKNVFQLRRNIGYVIQSIGLFPHLTIRENIEIVPSLGKKRKDKKQLLKRSKELMEMVGLHPDKFLDRYPVQLSGGQQQRVGVARAFAWDPEIILMDEPFSALDPINREQLQDELVQLQTKLKKTIVFVTHDMDEAIKVAHKICIINKGQILQYDTPEMILKNPVDDFVAKFVGKHRIWTTPELIRAEDIMLNTLVASQKDRSLLGCMETMRSRGVDSIFIVDAAGRLEGVVYAEDVKDVPDYQIPAGTVMHSIPYTARIQDSILAVLTQMKERKSPTVPVIDSNGKLAGIITKSSLVTTLSKRYFE
ncbi:MAG: ABC transporter ATP-binding protein [Treponema sp.]|nr:ABC transporter ATP-binding protein [Treponema sp.]